MGLREVGWGLVWWSGAEGSGVGFGVVEWESGVGFEVVEWG